ncbi:MAG: serine/threonine protein kinase [Deltaproteobacteria bacterium]|nr:serine/threonine protein kinase [Deltaproteobacteria bacterium]
MSDLVGRLIGGKYRVVQRLGGGAVADVYEAVHEGIGQHFALKVLKHELAAHPEVSERFLTEARAASAVRHPGVVQIFDHGKLEEGEPYLVMELLIGETLCDLVQRQKKLPQERAVGLLIQVLDALEAAHRAGVVHRDLKPENVVLVRGPDGEPWAKLIDFGIARLAREGAAMLRRTMQGTVMGTPYYMSPEQALGTPIIDGRTDVYAAGVVLFEILTGALPFQGSSPMEILDKVVSEPFPSLRTFEPTLPAALDEAILKATARPLDLRFQSAREFAQALSPLRSELVAVRFLSAKEERELEPSGGPVTTRSRLPRRSSPPPPPSPPHGTSSRSSTPPPIPGPELAIEAVRSTIAVPRRAVFLGAALVALAAVAGLLGLFSDGTSSSSAAALDGADHAVTASGRSSEHPKTGTSTRGSAPLPVAGVSLAALPAAVRAAPVATPAEQASAAPPPATLPVPVQAIVRLVGIPDGTEATLDGNPVGREFPLVASRATHTLRAVARGRKPFVHEFQVDGDLEIRVSLERERAGVVRRPERPAEPSNVPPDPPADEPAAIRGRRLANPFGGS